MLAIGLGNQHNKLLSSLPGEKLICDISAAVTLSGAVMALERGTAQM